MIVFYSDYGIRAYIPQLSHYILRFVAHYDQYINERFVRSVSYDDVVWC